jgi:hypothetical protein
MTLPFTQPQIFQGHALPQDARLVGYAALIQAWAIKAPLARKSVVSEHHIRGTIRQEEAWDVFDKRYQPEESIAGHLTFALKHETINLLALKRIFQAAPKTEIEQFVRQTPMGLQNRRAWFLYEFLLGEALDVPDAPNIVAVDILNPEQYVTSAGQLSKRHKVRNNLLGTSGYCPIIRQSEALKAYIALNLAEKAKETIGRVSGQLVARAASFMLLADSRASFEIEGERPPRNRLERWGKAIVQAGKHPLTLDEIVRLHSVLIADDRFIQLGFRRDGVFLGERDHQREPLPEFIGAKPEDVTALMMALIEANQQMSRSGVDPVLQAAATAFGFVYIHPLQDGNGRLHRCLIHHVLAERRFAPPGMVFPVSSVMLARIEDYRQTLQGHSSPLMDCIEWRPTAEGNVEVLNDTADLYRYADCTKEAEFLYGCVQQTVEQDLPQEFAYLKRHDEAMRRLMDTVDMPNRQAEDLILFIRQNQGFLPKARRKKEFLALTDAEVEELEIIVRELFEL